jgi:gamma-glutamylcyclotransferase (GGCT)/AIG2-like uncharacterized protein YtfP
VTEPPRLTLFAYGTLKRGHSNHERFCRGVLDVREATARGRLYDLPFGFPALVVPKEDVRAEGTSDYPADARESGPSPDACIPKASLGWDVIHGEILTFGDPEERLPSVDGLEGYRPGEPSLYRRILIPTAPSGAKRAVLAWTYAVGSASGVHLPGGRWPAG